MARCDMIGLESPEKAVEIVERWAKDHPVRTLQSVFLERYPNATIDKDGSIGICPAAIEAKSCYDLSAGMSCCKECRKHFWHKETDK